VCVLYSRDRHTMCVLSSIERQCMCNVQHREEIFVL